MRLALCGTNVCHDNGSADTKALPSTKHPEKHHFRVPYLLISLPRNLSLKVLHVCFFSVQKKKFSLLFLRRRATSTDKNKSISHLPLLTFALLWIASPTANDKLTSISTSSSECTIADVDDWQFPTLAISDVDECPLAAHTFPTPTGSCCASSPGGVCRRGICACSRAYEGSRMPPVPTADIDIVIL